MGRYDVDRELAGGVTVNPDQAATVAAMLATMDDGPVLAAMLGVEL